nr:NAD(P)H-hydrate epimerase [Nocardia brasiliensis]
MSTQRGYFTADEVRAAEAELFTRVPDGVPMQRAAYGLAKVVAAELRARTGGVAGRAVTLLVGSGDNGGDALWAGSMLRRRGVEVAAVLLNPARAHTKGLAALRKAGGRVRAEVGSPDLVVDGIVGISGRGSLRPDAAELVAGLRVPIVAADLPSGVDPDTGAVTGPAVPAAGPVGVGGPHAPRPTHPAHDGPHAPGVLIAEWGTVDTKWHRSPDRPTMRRYLTLVSIPREATYIGHPRGRRGAPVG